MFWFRTGVRELGFEPGLELPLDVTWELGLMAGSPHGSFLLLWALTVGDWINPLGTQRSKEKGARACCGGKNMVPGVFHGHAGIKGVA